MYTVNLDTLGIIHNFRLIAGIESHEQKKQSARREEIKAGEYKNPSQCKKIDRGLL